MGAKKSRSLLVNLLALNRLQTKQQETSLMAECNELEFELPGLSGRKIEGNFAGGNVSSDGGLVLLRQVDRWIGLTKTLAQRLPDGPRCRNGPSASTNGAAKKCDSSLNLSIRLRVGTGSAGSSLKPNTPSKVLIRVMF